MAGKLSLFSYSDGVRRKNHPLDLVRPHYPELVRLFEDPSQLEKVLLPAGGLTGSRCVQLIQRCVERIEERAGAAADAGHHRLYHSLTYLSDSFIPLLLLAQKSQERIMPVEHIRSSWPNVDRNVMHQGRLPALMHLVFQCCFWSDNSKKSIPIVHILTKGVPKRCQVRSLIDIIDKKQQEDRSLMNFILDIFNCFSLGGYEHSRVRPVFEMRKRLYSNLIFDKNAKNNVRTLFMHARYDTDLRKGKEKKVYENAGLMTLAVREYLCTCVQLIPSLHRVLVHHCDWASFEADVFLQADRARTLMNHNFAASHYWFSGLDAALNTKKSNKDSSIYQPIKNAFVSTLTTAMTNLEVDALCSGQPLPRIGEKGTFLYEQLDEQLRQAVSHTLSLYDLDQVGLHITDQLPLNQTEVQHIIQRGLLPLTAFGCSSESAAALRRVQEEYKREERAKFVHQLVAQLWQSPVDFALTHCLFREVELRNSVRLYPLPLHYVQYQYLALLRRHKLPLNTSLDWLAAHYGQIKVCMQCRTVRSFVVTPESNKKSFSFYAYGTDRVTIDHVTRRIYCTGKKRNDKPANMKKLSALLSSGDNFNPLDAERAVKKDKKRKLKKEGEWAQSQRCRETEITTFSILGEMFEFFGKSYLLCCHCGLFTEYNGRRYYEDAFVCGCCIQESEAPPLRCFMCTKERRKKSAMTTYKDIISDTGGGQGERITIHLCSTHNKPWIAAEYERHEQQPLTMSRIQQGYAEGWKSVTTASGKTVTVAATIRKRR